MSHQHIYISWTDNTHNRLMIEPNTTSIYIDKCHGKVKHFIYSCSLIKKNFNQLYECHPLKQNYSQKRLKRANTDKSKRSLYIFLLLVIGIPCFIIGIIAGISITIYISIKRQHRRERQNQQHMINKRVDLVNKPWNINYETLKRLEQNKIPIKSHVLNSTADHPSLRREKDILDNASITLNRYKTLQNQSLKREQSIMFQRPPVSNLAYMESAVTLGNMSDNLPKTHIQLKKQCKTSKNVNNNIKNSSIRDIRSKSC